MTARVHRYADSQQLQSGVAQHLARHIASAQARHASTTLCLSDGLSEVCAAFSAIADGIDPEKMSLWWSDDRFTTITDPMRVSTKTLAALGTALRFAPDRVHPMPSTSGNADVDAAALQYAGELGETTFDLAVLAMGNDGSVAGLAPGSAAYLRFTPHTVVGITDAAGGRLTLSLQTLSRAQVVWLIAAGSGAADALAKTVTDDVSLPSGALRGRVATHIFADEAAAAKLPWFTCEV